MRGSGSQMKRDCPGRYAGEDHTEKKKRKKTRDAGYRESGAGWCMGEGTECLCGEVETG